MHESKRLAEFLAGATYADLPQETVAATTLAILDWIGSALAGSLESPARMAQGVVAGLGASDEASVLPSGRSSAAGAALANGVASHILELDDIHKGSTVHGAAPIVPAALAAAEREQASGRDLLLAVALGYDAALRVGEAVNPSHYRTWHPTGTAATFGAAAAAASLLRLDAGRMLDALGSAGTQAAGLWEFNADGAMSKHLHPGKAAFNGVLAADLAKRGFTGATRIIEGERGFIRAMSDGGDASRITDGLGTRWKVVENGYKLHACCGHTHTAVDSAIELRDGVAIDQIEAIRIALYGPGFEIVKESNPRTPYQAKFSVAYCVAAALAEGVVGLDQFDQSRFDPTGTIEPLIATLLARTSVAVAGDLTARYPARWPSRLTLLLRDGATLEREADYPLGHPENPVPRATLERKAHNLIAPRFGANAADRALAFVAALTETPDVDVAMRNVHASLELSTNSASDAG
ncbi:MAG: MmgE/PrpD family protein [Thermomicrobiales bacterium]|nr:MmgE/PrpD family protein [Thermomicrobiales bacterium]